MAFDLTETQYEVLLQRVTNLERAVNDLHVYVRRLVGGDQVNALQTVIQADVNALQQEVSALEERVSMIETEPLQ